MMSIRVDRSPAYHGHRMSFKNQFDTAKVGVEFVTPARRLPVQSRSQQTVQRVLDAASFLTHPDATGRHHHHAHRHRSWPLHRRAVPFLPRQADHHRRHRRASRRAIPRVARSHGHEDARARTRQPGDLRPGAASSTASSTPTLFISTRIPTSAPSRLAATSAPRPKSARRPPLWDFPRC